MKIPKTFTAPHTPANTGACAALKRDASRVLRRFASDLALRQRDFTISTGHRSRLRQDVFSLQTDSLHVQIMHGAEQGTATMSFRSCRGRTDLAGGRENAVCLQSVATPEGYAEFLQTLRIVAGRQH